MAKVYLDTSFVSACVTTRNDPASTVRHETSNEWFNTQSHHHEVFISAEVKNELDHPDYPRREAALAFVAALPTLAITDDVLGLAAALVTQRVMPAPVGATQSMSPHAASMALSTC